MKLSRIRIEQFRQFRRSIEFKDLEPGINLFVGPNEAGKSTIATAIRSAFFERHRSGSVEDLRPWDDSSASPTIELDFVIGEQAYRLVKSFLGKKRCELSIGSRRLDGAEAEDHLAELLGFRYAGRGASAAEHRGIPGLLWIEQGCSQNLHESVAHATDHLRSALNESLGELTGSTGDEIMALVAAARNELLTPTAGSPRGAYAEAAKQEQHLAEAIGTLDAEIGAYRQKVDALASLQREHALDEAEKPWVGFRAQQKAAEDKLDATRLLETTLAGEAQHADQLDSRITLLRDQLETFASHDKALAQRREDRAAAAQALAGALSLVEQWGAKRAEASARYDAARETLRLSRLEDTRLNLGRRYDEARRTADQIAATMKQAEAHQARLLDYRQQAAATEIVQADLERLRERQRRIRELQIQQAAAATRVRFTIDEGRSLLIGEESVSGSGETLLFETTSVVLPEIGSLEITPGGTGLGDLRRKEQALKDEQSAALQALGLESLDAAEIRHGTHQRTLGEIKAVNATLNVLAPQGLDALRTELTTLLARVEELHNALSQLPPPADQAEPPPAIATADADVENAAQSLANISEYLHRAQVDVGHAQTADEAAARELATAEALRDAPHRAERLAAAERDLVDAKAERATIGARIEALTRQIAEALPDILRQDVERYRKSAEQHERRHTERREALMRLEVELQAVGARGLDERRAELARDRAQARRRFEELQRRARALDYLLDLLREKRRALTRRLQQPLQQHLNHYLQLLFPRASLEIDEDLGPGPLTRCGADGVETGDFGDLSFGAREQTGVITRLAYADLLRTAGRPTLLILDDALVHSDDERLAQMKRILFDAASRHQILLFTCHPEKWRDLGVRSIGVEAMRA